MEAVIRAKFTVESITQTRWGGEGREIVLRPQYDPDSSEDRSFSKATPSGELRMSVDNPQAIEKLSLGRVFYLDFVPVEG